MKTRLTYIALSVFCFAVIAFLFYRNPRSDGRTRKVIYNFDPTKCPGEIVKFKSPDPYMRGIVEDNQEVEVTVNYFACRPVKVGQVALYRFSEFDEPVLRRVVAVAGDRFELQRVKGQGWMLKVNGEPVKGVRGELFVWGNENVPPPLALAADQRKGRLVTGEAIVLASFPPGEKDSSLFGVINVGDLIGIKADAEVPDQGSPAKSE